MQMRGLIVGAGEAGQMMARDLRRVPEFGFEPVGFLDDNAKRSVAGLPVLGILADLPRVVAEQRVDMVIIAIPSLPSWEINRLSQAASDIGVSVSYLPTFVAAMERDARVSDLRHLRVDLLLGREVRRVIRPASRAVIEGRRILVTGAGGSIGSELCRQLRRFHPSAIYLLDHDESNLHSLQLELDGHALLDDGQLLIADIRDRSRIRQIFQEVEPEVVFHAAAHKHLPLLERHPCEGVKTNVLGTKHLVDAALEVETERFVLISTDKAADPTSILGASKRLAEIVLQQATDGPTKFGSVRFGNVLGSRGSFLSVLTEQLASGEAVTVTHPEVTRFFMTIEEAVGLVIEAASMAEDAGVFVLDMGEPVRIVDLVHSYAAQLHMEEPAFTIHYTGLRRGEKLSEALFGQAEEYRTTRHPNIWFTPPRPVGADFPSQLERLFKGAEANRPDEVRDCLADLLPEYRASAMGAADKALAAPYPDGF
jgi:FlaA1/EpsC-like NDP-sugar epimerase